MECGERYYRYLTIRLWIIAAGLSLLIHVCLLRALFGLPIHLMASMSRAEVESSTTLPLPPLANNRLLYLIDRRHFVKLSLVHRFLCFISSKLLANVSCCVYISTM